MLGIDDRINRPFIERLRNDSRMRALLTSWVHEATIEVTERLGRYRSEASPEKIAHEAAEAALIRAMTFILDNDGEYKMVCEERDRLMKAFIDQGALRPAPFMVVPKPDA